MKKFNIGDEVTICEDLSASMKVRCGVTSEMEAFRGKKAKIVHASNSYYQLNVDNERWNWSLGMFLEFKIEISAILEKHLKWLRGDKEGERANLSDTDLRGADLSNADLSDAYLRGADLRGAYLRGAYLKGADLSVADLSDADLSGASLSGANLRGADLSNADLSDAYLRGADLRGAYLRGAYLKGADLKGANLSDANLSDTDLRGANLSDANLNDANLSDANLFCKGNVYKLNKIITVSNIGSRNDTTYIYITQCNNVIVRCGCFFNLINEFEQAVHKTHSGTKYEKEYMLVIELAKAQILGVYDE